MKYWIVCLIYLYYVYGNPAHEECSGQTNSDNARVTFVTTRQAGEEDPPVTSCITSNVCTYEVHVISIRAPEDGIRNTGETVPSVVGNMTVQVEVMDNTVSRPIKLVLTSKEATQWIIRLPTQPVVTIEDIIIVSKYVANSSVAVMGSPTPVRDWQIHEAHFGYLQGWREEETLLFTVEEWLGMVTSFTGTDTARAATLRIGLPRSDHQLTCGQDPVAPNQEGCDELMIMYPFKRGKHVSSEHLHQSYSCYTGVIGDGHEVHALSIYEPSGPKDGWFSPKSVVVHVEQFTNEDLHPVHLLLSSYYAVACTVVISSGITVTDVTLASKYADGSSLIVTNENGEPLSIPAEKIEVEYDYSGTEYDSMVTYAKERFGFLTSYTGVREAENLIVRVGVRDSLVANNVPLTGELVSTSRPGQTGSGSDSASVLLVETTMLPKDGTILKHNNGSLADIETVSENENGVEEREELPSKNKQKKEKTPLLGASRNVASRPLTCVVLAAAVFGWHLLTTIHAHL